MNASDIQHGNPTVEGRYVTFVRCQAVSAQEWVEPIIMTWAGGRFHTTFISKRRILGWLGPLPVMKATDLAPDETHPMPVGDEPERYFEDSGYAPKPPVFDL